MRFAKLRVVHCLLLCIPLFGCAPQEQPPLRVGLVLWPPYELFFLAEDLGYYENVQVQLVDYQTPAEALRAYENGVIDAVAMTADFLLQVAARSPDHRAVLVIDASLGGDALIAKPGIESVAELRGKVVGLEMSTLGQLMLTRALESGGLTPDEVSPRFVDIPDQELAFASGELDAVVTYEPVRTGLLRGDGVLLFDSSQIPGQIVDLLFARKRTIELREQTLQSVIDGYFRALEFLRENPTEAASRLAQRENLSADEFLQALELVELQDREANRLWLGPSAPRLRDTFEKVFPVMLKYRKTSADLDLEILIDDRFVESASP